MPALAVKIKTTPNNRSTTINGTSHHFFSCFENCHNSFRSDHMSSSESKIYIIARKANVRRDAAQVAQASTPAGYGGVLAASCQVSRVEGQAPRRWWQRHWRSNPQPGRYNFQLRSLRR